MILCVAVSVRSTSTDVAVTVKIWMKLLTGTKGLSLRAAAHTTKLHSAGK